jgi:CheY-like chemotaxis protein
LVAVSGYGRDDDREESREAGFDAYLTKPVDPEELARLVSSE